MSCWRGRRVCWGGATKKVPANPSQCLVPALEGTHGTGRARVLQPGCNSVAPPSAPSEAQSVPGEYHVSPGVTWASRGVVQAHPGVAQHPQMCPGHPQQWPRRPQVWPDHP